MSIFTENNLSYIIMTNSQLKLCGFKPDYHEGHVKIPNRVNGLPITRIGLFAFMGDKVLEAVDIPENIDTIEVQAFECCPNLKYVFFSNHNSILNISQGSFSHCELLTSVTILRPTNISIEAFRGCKNLRHVDINALEIDNYAFAECDQLHTVLLRGKTLTIGEKAFAKSPRMDKIYIDAQKVSSFDFVRFLPVKTEIHCPKGSNVEELAYEGFKVLTDI